MTSQAPFQGNAPANDSDIGHFERETGITLPQSYVKFLRNMNGGCGFVGPAYVDIWPVDKIIEYNCAYSADKYVPELLLFGSDGGGEAFAFDRRSATWPIVRVPFIPLDVREAVVIAQSFVTFFDALTQGSTDNQH